MDDIIDELRSVANFKDDGTDDFISMGKMYDCLPISRKNFHPIEDNGTWNTLFVDGGNSVLFDSPGFCLALIRTAAVQYTGNKRVKRSSEDFYIVIREVKSKFLVKTFPATSFNGLIFDPDDDSLKIGIEKCNISRIVPVVRRLAELDYAKRLDTHDLDFIILDGTLESRYPHEMECLKSLLLTGKAASLSKTCSLTTKHGLSIIKKLYDMDSDDAWYYFPALINKNPHHLAEIYFVRLHKNSDYVFRFELQHGFNKDRLKLFSSLKFGSADRIFIGYPYGLIDVDSAARISEDETSMLRMRFAAKLGKEWKAISRLLNSMNAHDILDNIRF